MGVTSLDIFFPEPSDFVKASGSTEALREHLQKMASTANAAILREVAKITEVIELVGGEDLNDFRTTGRYILRVASSAGPIANLPPGINQTVFLLKVDAYTRSSFNYVMQDYSGLSGTGAGYFRRNTSGASGALFIPWRRLDNEMAVSAGGTGIANVLRVQEFKDALGQIGTQGKAAVALRFDHGLNNFNSKIRPLLEARNLPYCLALSSRGWTVGENNTVTPAMVNSWTGCEVWNHGAGPNHNDASDTASLQDQIVAGKEELQSQLPDKPIWGFIPPGVGGTNYGGFNGGNSPEAFYGTMAGQLILENHAVSAGAFPGTAYRPLDGEVRQGMGHAGLETRSVSSAKSIIDSAIASKTGLQLMTHPSRLDEAGYHTTADLTQMLDYIVQKRNAGELVVLSPYQMMVADARQQIIVKETAGRTVSVWDYLNNREQLIYGDTGERDISSLLVNATGVVRLQRTGGTVHLYLQSITPTITGSGVFLNLPSGFRPSTQRAFQLNVASAGSAYRSAYMFTSGGVGAWLQSPTDSYSFTYSFPTANPWPTTLPGAAVGSIPA